MHALRIVLRVTVVWWGLVAWLLLLAAAMHGLRRLPRSLPISSWSDPSASPLPPWAATQASVGPSAILCGGVLGEDGTDHRGR